MSTLPEPLITISPEYLSGAPVFTGTRVPVQALFDCIEGGDPLDEFRSSLPLDPTCNSFRRCCRCSTK